MNNEFNTGKNRGREPYWKPDSFGKWYAKLMAALLLTLLLIFLISLFSIPRSRIIDSWNQPISGGEEVGLPAPEDNQIPPIGDRGIRPNPVDSGLNDIVSDLLYVILDTDSISKSIMQYSSRLQELYPDVKVGYYNSSAGTMLLEVPGDQLVELWHSLPTTISDIKHMVVPVELLAYSNEQTRSNYRTLSEIDAWHLKSLNMNDAWEITEGSKDVVIAIVDSYFDLSHEDLRDAHIIAPYSVASGGGDVQVPSNTDEISYMHGTHVASVAIASKDNGIGTAGIAPKCSFMPVSIGDQLTNIGIMEGLLYAIHQGADVISISIGSSLQRLQSMPVYQQIALAERTNLDVEKVWDYIFALAKDRHATIVWAAGNDGVFIGLDTSKRNNETIKVSAVDTELNMASFTNFGNFPKAGVSESTISAPGVDIWGAIPNNRYDKVPGTSFSAPIIAGVVGLMKSLDSSLTSSEIIKYLRDTAVPVKNAPQIGPLVQVDKALKAVQNRKNQ